MAGKVGVILPDSATSPRWEANDRPLLEAAFEEANIDADIQNADGDTSKFATICDGMINEVSASRDPFGDPTRPAVLHRGRAVGAEGVVGTGP